MVQPLAVLDEEAVLRGRGGVGVAGCTRLHELLKTGPNVSIVRNLEKEEEEEERIKQILHIAVQWKLSNPDTLMTISGVHFTKVSRF